MEGRLPYPFQIYELEESEAKEVKKYFSGETYGFVRVGPKRYFVRQKYKEQAEDIYNLLLKRDDIFVSGFPRSGCTWVRELVWLVANDFNYAEASAVSLSNRFVFLELSFMIHKSIKEQLLKTHEGREDKKGYVELYANSGTKRLAATPSPRFVLTHLPLSLLPPRLLDSSKVVYMARDPRNVVVSFYHLSKLFKGAGFEGDFKAFWDLFRNDSISYTSYFASLKEAWKERHHPNMLFMFYEDMAKDLPACVRRVCSFLNKPCSEEQMTRLCEHLRFDNFKTNKSVNLKFYDEIGLLSNTAQPFIRKGKAGGWRECFTEEMEQQANEWIHENLRDTDLRFPSMTTD